MIYPYVPSYYCIQKAQFWPCHRFSQIYQYFTCLSPEWDDWVITYTQAGFTHTQQRKRGFRLWLKFIMLPLFLLASFTFGLLGFVQRAEWLT
jgi:hypothetical protein